MLDTSPRQIQPHVGKDSKKRSLGMTLKDANSCLANCAVRQGKQAVTIKIHSAALWLHLDRRQGGPGPALGVTEQAKMESRKQKQIN